MSVFICNDLINIIRRLLHKNKLEHTIHEYYNEFKISYGDTLVINFDFVMWKINFRSQWNNTYNTYRKSIYSFKQNKLTKHFVPQNYY